VILGSVWWGFCLPECEWDGDAEEVEGVRISSYRLNGNCRVADYCQGTNYSGSKRTGYRGDNWFVGASWNDQLFSMHVRS